VFLVINAQNYQMIDRKPLMILNIYMLIENFNLYMLN